MSELTGLTSKLIEKADKDLHKQISDAADPLRNLLRSGGNCVFIQGKEYAHWEVLAALEGLVFNTFANHERQKAIDDFFRKVNSL